jgi:hypothetical protein
VCTSAHSLKNVIARTIAFQIGQQRMGAIALDADCCR